MPTAQVRISQPFLDQHYQPDRRLTDDFIPPAPKMRAVYVRHDVNTDVRQVWESDDPDGENLINPGQRPLHGHDAGNGIITYNLHLYRSGYIGVWASNHAYPAGARVRRASTDIYVWQVVQPGTSGAEPPDWIEAYDGGTTVDGTVEWFPWGPCDPIVGQVPGTHLRLDLTLTLSPPYFGGGPGLIIARNVNSHYSPAAAAPPDLDMVFAPAWRDAFSYQTIYSTDVAVAGTLELEVGDGTEFSIYPQGPWEEWADVLVHRFQFFTPPPSSPPGGRWAPRLAAEGSWREAWPMTLV